MNCRQQNQAAFSLMELLAVVAILGILAALILPRVSGGNDMANLVLAHESCNKTAANLSISEKVDLRAKMRSSQNA